jgi:hypothetical protein
MIKIPSRSTPTGADAELIALGVLLERCIKDRATWNPITASLDEFGPIPLVSHPMIGLISLFAAS